MNMHLNDRNNYYLSLINKPYSELISILVKKYGNVLDNFFSEKSYQRFLNGEIKSIAHGKYKRTNEGLYTHHIFENQFENLSNLNYIREFKYDFYYQRKENLVYCDLVEHLILHAAIINETDGEFGFSGYEYYLKDMVEEWFTTDMVPKPNWMKIAYQRAFLTPDQTKMIIQELENGPLKKTRELLCEQNRMQEIAGKGLDNLWHDSKGNLILFWSLFGDEDFNALWEKLETKTSEYIGNDELLKHDIRVLFKDYLYSSEESTAILQKRAKQKEKEQKEREEIEHKKYVEWVNEHQLISEQNVDLNTPRRKILKMLFNIKYNKQYDNFKSFTSSRINKIRDDLYDELEQVLEEQAAHETTK